MATEFIDRYTEAFGDAPSTFAGHAYDALLLIVEAAKRIEGDITAEALRDEIEATSGFVGIGGTFTFSAEDHNGMTVNDLIMYEISGGDWTLIDEPTLRRATATPARFGPGGEAPWTGDDTRRGTVD